jgi:hypothetical protein
VADGWRQGYWRNDDGALICEDSATAVGAHWQDGFLIDGTGALITTTVLTGAKWDPAGYLRAPDGALVIGSVPAKWQDGMLLDSNGALVTVAYPAAGQVYSQGYLRNPAGALVIV